MKFDAVVLEVDGTLVRTAELHAKEGIRLYRDAIEQLRVWRRYGLGIAFISSSRNASRVLEAAGLNTLCDIRVDGLTGKELEIEEKEGLMREAVRGLDAEPTRTLAIESSLSGVRAAARIGFGGIVGIARDSQWAEFVREGATQVVENLDDLRTLEMVEPGTRRPSELPSALRLDFSETRIGTRAPVVFLDFDGTLSKLVDHPDDAVMSDETRNVLRMLSERCVVGVISGRDRVDVEQRVELPHLWYVGSHGFDVRSPDGREFSPEGVDLAAQEIVNAEKLLQRELPPVSGLVIERKRFGLAVHYRTAYEEDTTSAIHQVREVAEISPHLQMRSGERVIELCPDVEWNKGHAVNHLLKLMEASEKTTIPLYIGDGYTDEDAFRALKHRGLTIRVGTPIRPTYANFRLTNPDEVRAFLERLISWIDHRGTPSSFGLVE